MHWQDICPTIWQPNQPAMKTPKEKQNPQKVREEKEFPRTPGYKTPAGSGEADSPKKQIDPDSKKSDPSKTEWCYYKTCSQHWLTFIKKVAQFQLITRNSQPVTNNQKKAQPRWKGCAPWSAQ